MWYASLSEITKHDANVYGKNFFNVRKMRTVEGFENYDQNDFSGPNETRRINATNPVRPVTQISPYSELQYNNKYINNLGMNPQAPYVIRNRMQTPSHNSFRNFGHVDYQGVSRPEAYNSYGNYSTITGGTMGGFFKMPSRMEQELVDATNRITCNSAISHIGVCKKCRQIALQELGTPLDYISTRHKEKDILSDGTRFAKNVDQLDRNGNVVTRKKDVLDNTMEIVTFIATGIFIIIVLDSFVRLGKNLRK